MIDETLNLPYDLTFQEGYAVAEYLENHKCTEGCKTNCNNCINYAVRVIGERFERIRRAVLQTGVIDLRKRKATPSV